jgi:hypothetical protein
MPRLRHLPLLIPALLSIGCGRDRGGSTVTEDLVRPETPARQAESVGYATMPKEGAPGDRNSVVASDTAAALPPDAQTPPSTAPGAPAQPVIPQMIIRTGTATVQVDSLEAAIARVEQLARRLGGYVANTSVETGAENVRRATLEMKLPADRWSQALGGLKPIGKLESQQTQSQDVGEEFVDVTARMTNARRLESRLLELLATRTGKLDDVLAVERELSRVREEIERAEGRLRFLRSRVAVSTLTVELHEPLPVLAPGHSPILDAFRQAWRNFIGFMAGLIASLGWLIPLALALAAAVWLLRRLFGGRDGLPDRRFSLWRRGNGPKQPPV